ncbi:MAG: hypothetical protein AB1631_34950, partial [Acidobacteriota bacterium]
MAKAKKGMWPKKGPGANEVYPLHHSIIKPHAEGWRELMLDMGAPMESQWKLHVSVYAEKSNKPPYAVHEMVFVEPSWWASPEADIEIERYSPLFTDRMRFFLFDVEPTSQNVPPVPSLFPKQAFIEIKSPWDCRP